MGSTLLTSLGKIAGLGGISIGVFLLIFQGVLRREFLPRAGSNSVHAFAIMLSLMILTFGIAGIGIISWLIGLNTNPTITGPALTALSGLTALVVVSAVYVGTRSSVHIDNRRTASSTERSPANPRRINHPLLRFFGNIAMVFLYLGAALYGLGTIFFIVALVSPAALDVHGGKVEETVVMIFISPILTYAFLSLGGYLRKRLWCA